MANKTINDLTALSGVASADYFPMWDVSGVVTRKATLTNILAVLLAQANTFTNVQTVAPTSTSVDGLNINMPASTTAFPIVIRVGGVDTIFFYPASNATHPGGAILIQSYDSGNNAKGPFFFCGHNTNATKPGAGFVRLNSRNATSYRIWVDNTGLVRINTSDPIYDNDVAGTIVGTQSSTANAKNILSDVGDPREALQAIIDAARNGLKRFTYKSGSFNNEEFEGIVTDYAPRYGMDRDAEHPAGKSLNEIQLFGDLIRAVALLAEKIGLVEDKS